jgi:hypothetical protein
MSDDCLIDYREEDHFDDLCIHLWLYSPCGTWPLFSFLILRHSVGLLGRGISPSQGCYLHREHHNQNKGKQTSMPRVGFEPTIPAFERTERVYVLDRAVTVIGYYLGIHEIILNQE